MQQCLLGHTLLGKVHHWVRRYEAQGRGCLHAHILLWVDESDIERVAQEITASMPCTYQQDSTTGMMKPNIPPPGDGSLVSLLCQQVLLKQMHTCRHNKYGCRPADYGNQPRCKKLFPFQPHRQGTTFDALTNRYEYFRFCEYDMWIVPYHPGVLLCWNGHMNIQRITNTDWSYYVLKYAAKAEPTGELEVDEHVMQALGITDISPHQAQLAVSEVLAKPFSPSEAYCIVTGIPIIAFSEDIDVTYIDTQPPHKRSRIVRDTHISLAPIDLYCNRPINLLQLGFDDYWTNYEVRPKKLGRPRAAADGIPAIVDRLNNNVWQLARPRIVRYTDHHPVYQTQGFFYQMLLMHRPFQSEEELTPDDGDYFAGKAHACNSHYSAH
jgi:hypothetical protein